MPRIVLFMKLYRTFGGYTTEAKDLEEASILAELTQDKFELERDYFYTAGYNSPWKFTGRRNEIWFVIRGDKESKDTSGAAGGAANGTPLDKPVDKPVD